MYNNNFINQHETINEDSSFLEKNFDDNEELNNEILDNYYNNNYDDDNNNNDNNINISFDKLMTNNNQSNKNINDYHIIDDNNTNIIDSKKIKYKKQKKNIYVILLKKH